MHEEFCHFVNILSKLLKIMSFEIMFTKHPVPELYFMGLRRNIFHKTADRACDLAKIDFL